MDAPQPNPTDIRHADLELVRRALADERRSVDGLTRRLECVVAILTARNARLGRPLNEHELADLAQETLVLVWRKLPGFEGRSSLETWVYRICCLELLNSFRKKGRRRASGVGGEDDPLAETPADDPPTRLDYEHVYRSLERLGPPEADVVRLKHFEGLTFEEIGQRLGISPNTAKTQYYRGLERLRDYLRPHMEEGDT